MKTPTISTHLSLAASLIGWLVLPTVGDAGVFKSRPDVLVCSVEDPISVQPWDELVFYVSALLEDGSVLYKSLTSNPVLAKVTPDGKVDAKNLADCDGKTVPSFARQVVHSISSEASAWCKKPMVR
ncbi:MAG: hypothetical protein AAFU66_08255 [Pseudomonadota bacterium]